jgi:predicted N-formylglutamate amidohydrolase
MLLRHAGDTTGVSLLGQDDPAPYSVVDGAGARPVLLVCDHAGAAIPTSLGTLGLAAADLDDHITVDIGAAPLTRDLAGCLGVDALLATYSRLVIDCNRELEDYTLIREVSDGRVIAGNRSLDEAAVAARVSEIFHPYHLEIRRRFAAMRQGGAEPVLVSIHTFTPMFRGFERPWHVGVLSGTDRRFADPLIAALSAEKGLVVGDNKPYSGLAFAGYTIETHAMASGSPNVMIEVRQDLVDTADGVARWVDILNRALAPVLEEFIRS